MVDEKMKRNREGMWIRIPTLYSFYRTNNCWKISTSSRAQVVLLFSLSYLCA